MNLTESSRDQDENDNGEIISWEEEAKAVINDVREFLQDIHVSPALDANSQIIHINMKTFEDKEFCIELTSLGFRVVGTSYDDITEPTDEWFDTPYALLGKLSDSFNERFAQALASKLKTVE